MSAPVLLWFRRDLRLSDHPALTAACAAGGPVIPVVILDDLTQMLGTAPAWRLGKGLNALETALKSKGAKLIYRSGDALATLEQLIAETGAKSVYWTRAYDPESIARDTAVKAALTEAGIAAKSFRGHLMFEPWTSETKAGGFYKVYTPYWRAQKDRVVDAPLPTPAAIPVPEAWPKSETLTDWHLGAGMRRGAAVVEPFANIGEAAAQDRLAAFMEKRAAYYPDTRDLPEVNGTSCLSENLALGEISANQCWHAGQRALAEGRGGVEGFLRQLVWREFAYHLMFHTPHITSGNWRPEWDAFPWNEDETAAHVTAWQQGRTGIQFVDASMRELYTTGRMHNRGRMIVASYLTKHLLTHWRIGLKWFEDCLIDWDPACNAMGWQWAAGSGPDAAPYFRIFNPDTQRQRFDPNSAYIDRWIAEGKRQPHADALRFYDAIPLNWSLTANDRYPAPIVGLSEGRTRALAAYKGPREPAEA